MYSKTALGAEQLARGPLPPRVKRRLLAVIAAVATAAIGFGVWSAVGADSYGPSGNGCVNVTFAGSMGGEQLHYCGNAAKSYCQTAYTRSDSISMQGRHECTLAGFNPAKRSPG
jgi:hypothetical protein